MRVSSLPHGRLCPFDRSHRRRREGIFFFYLFTILPVREKIKTRPDGGPESSKSNVASYAFRILRFLRSRTRSRTQCLYTRIRVFRQSSGSIWVGIRRPFLISPAPVGNAISLPFRRSRVTARFLHFAGELLPFLDRQIQRFEVSVRARFIPRRDRAITHPFFETCYMGHARSRIEAHQRLPEVFNPSKILRQGGKSKNRFLRLKLRVFC